MFKKLLYEKSLPKIPKSLFVCLAVMTVVPSLLIVNGGYLYKFHNGTSWNFGAMGMYSSIDYPGIRTVRLIYNDLTSKTKRSVNLLSQSGLFFKEYESFVSLPNKKNAQKLKNAIKKTKSLPEDFRVELWTLKYDKHTKIVSSHKLESF